MPNNTAFSARVNELLSKLDENPSVDKGIELANEIVKLIGDVHTKSVEDVFESSIELPNAERYDSWFQPHPIFKSDRACFDLADTPLLEAKFYWLKKHSRQILAGGVHFTPNYEDEDFTHNERYRVGLDFFLSPDSKALQVVLSNRGNLRILELSRHLNNTQLEIFDKWVGASTLKTQEALHTTLWESFKLKSVNQKFYDGVSNSFTELLQHLKNEGRDEEESKLFSSRLLGRLLFCWFLRKKGIIDESAGYFNAEKVDATNYYKQSLERLFFLTLNTPIDERDELTRQHQKALFPESLVDGQANLFKIDQTTPYLNGGLFEPHENDWYRDDSLTLPEGFFVNVYQHFEEFNFTTDESSPEYEQIAIDPEMLGRVFESLLATQVDETGQQARKAKGAFYTPREIVGYMCKESLRNYLYSSTGNDEGIKESIDSLLDISDSEWAKSKSNTLRDKVKDNRTRIMDALDIVTILDPACGSGAFPMGMLQLMLKTYERLESRFDPYKTKLSIIQNNIFGVDIEPMAVEISRLRAWLSLIVDEENPHGVEPLPNLDFKFIAANSLIKPDKSFGLDESKQATNRSKMQGIINRYFKERDRAEKQKLKAEFMKLESYISQVSMFGDSKAHKQTQSFKPFNNLNVAEFFDPKLMFGLDSQSPFDIVIGNPPYISTEKISEPVKSVYKDNYADIHSSRIDIYAYFYRRGLELSKQKTGLLCYITSNKWMRAGYGQKIRSYFAEVNPLQLIDFGGFKVFESATVDTNIILIQNSSNRNMLIASHFKNDFKKEQSVSEYFNSNSIRLHNSSGKPWFIGNQSDQKLKEKIELVGIPLKNWDLRISRGIMTGLNEAYILDESTKERLVDADPNSIKIIKPLIRGRDIKRYALKFSNVYVLTVGFGDYKLLPKKYPAIYQHLLQFEEKLKKRGQCIASRSGKSGSPDYPGQHHWLELDNNPGHEYFNEFEKEKLIWPETMRVHRNGDPNFPRFNIKEKGTYLDKTVYMMDFPHPRFILGLLNSKMGWKILDQYVDKLDKGGYMMQKAMVENLPIPDPATLDQELVFRLEDYVQKVCRLRAADVNADITTYEREINNLSYKIYNLTPEEIDIVEGIG